MPVDTSSPTPSPTPAPTYSMSPKELAAVAAFAQSMGGGSTASSLGQVYLGTRYQILPQLLPGQPGYGEAPTLGGGMGQSHELGGTRPDNSPYWASVQDAQKFFGSFSPKQISDFTAMGIMAGQLRPGDGWLEAGNLWDKLVVEAARAGANGQQVAPMDILRTYINNQQSAGSWKKSADGMFETNQLTGQRRYIGPQFRTTTSSMVNLTDPATAHAVATSVFQQMLGRDPLPGELNAYASALTQQEQANPTILTTTNQYDDLGNVIATTKQDQKGGYSADAQKFLAAQQVKAKPEYGATQAATTYENAFENAVFGQAR